MERLRDLTYSQQQQEINRGSFYLTQSFMVIAQPRELGVYRRFIHYLGRFSMGKPSVLHVLPNLSGQKKPETRIFRRLSNY